MGWGHSARFVPIGCPLFGYGLGALRPFCSCRLPPLWLWAGGTPPVWPLSVAPSLVMGWGNSARFVPIGCPLLGWRLLVSLVGGWASRRQPSLSRAPAAPRVGRGRRRRAGGGGVGGGVGGLGTYIALRAHVFSLLQSLPQPQPQPFGRDWKKFVRVYSPKTCFQLRGSRCLRVRK